MKPTSPPAPLRVQAARYEVDEDGYPLLVLTIDGKEARILREAKPTLADAGIVYLGGEWSGLVPVITFDADGDPRNRTELEGFTRDPRVFALWSQFRTLVDLDQLEPGPVPVPALK